MGVYVKIGGSMHGIHGSRKSVEFDMEARGSIHVSSWKLMKVEGSQWKYDECLCASSWKSVAIDLDVDEN